MPTDLEFSQQMALAKSVARNDFAAAIAILRKSSPQTAENLAFIAQCHWWLADEPKAIAAAHEATQLEPRCFDAHRILASLYARRRDHALAHLHTRQALAAYRPPAPLPKVVRWISVLFTFLVRGRAAASTTAQQLQRLGDETAWLQWGNDYVRWSDERGTLVAANQEFRPAPLPSPGTR